MRSVEGSMDRAVLRSLAVVLALTLAGCGSATPEARLASKAAPGTIVGVYVEQDRLGADRRPVPGVTIGVFAQAFLPGTNQFAPPTPLAVAVTRSDGGFEFASLPPGHYFVVPTDAQAAVAGEWLVISGERGATLTLVGCRDCPLPE
jgi:hypothetical protein